MQVFIFIIKKNFIPQSFSVVCRILPLYEPKTYDFNVKICTYFYPKFHYKPFQILQNLPHNENKTTNFCPFIRYNYPKFCPKKRLRSYPSGHTQ